MLNSHRRVAGAIVVISTAVLASISQAHAVLGDKPDSIVGAIYATRYDGVTNDLLTAGLGTSGLGSGTAPSVSTPPSVEELRRLAIWTNYRALVDPTVAGGYSVLYGPNVTIDGTATQSQGLIAGTEIIAQARVRRPGDAGRENVTFMVQIPDTYNAAKGCLVTAPSSGSRGVYGAIATAGEWGLKHGCAVVYTDKGSGTGAHDLHNNLVDLVRGQFVDAATAGEGSQFTANLSDAERADYDARYPYRFAFKHAHSQVNPEAAWGTYVLESIRFAFWALNQYAPNRQGPITRRNTLVIASSVSNGGGASLRAVEEDREGLIDGAAVGEPNVNPKFLPSFVIQQGTGAPFANHSRPLVEYVTFANLYAGCAAAAYPAGLIYLNLAASAARCQSLVDKGLLTGTTVAERAADAQKRLTDYGFLPEQNTIIPSHWFAYVPQSISVTYVNAYARASVADNVCDYSFAATTAASQNQPVPLPSAALLFGTSNGIPPTSGINLVNNGVGKEDRSSTLDQNLNGALCLFALATGRDAVTNAALTGADAVLSARVSKGAREVIASGNLRAVPAIWVAGRSDGILPPNFTGRAYYGLTQSITGPRTNTRYYEVTNAQHLDSFNQFPGYANTMVPLHVYFIQAMNLMYAYLTQGTPLPPSQVVKTTPRGGALGTAAPPISAANVPPIQSIPSASDLITFDRRVLYIPQ